MKPDISKNIARSAPPAPEERLHIDPAPAPAPKKRVGRPPSPREANVHLQLMIPLEARTRFRVLAAERNLTARDMFIALLNHYQRSEEPQ